MPDPKKAAYDEKAYLSPFSVITSQRKRKEATSWRVAFSWSRLLSIISFKVISKA